MNWNKESESLKINENSNLEEQVRDLRRRIEKLRSELCSPRSESIERDEEMGEPPRNVEPPREVAEREIRNAELNDIKAKLLGRKK